MALSFRLRYINTDTAVENTIDIMSKTLDYSQGSISFNNKIVQGTANKGVQIGTGWVNPNRKLDFTIPIYDQSNTTLDKQISFFTSIFSNRKNIKFYLERFYNEKWYYAEISISDFGAYKTDFTKQIGNVKVSFNFIDNNFISPDATTVRLFENKLSGVSAVNYQSNTDIPVPCVFQWKLANTESDVLLANFYSVNGYGVRIQQEVDGEVSVKYNGETVDINGEIYFANGIAPEILPGITQLSISSNFETEYFDLTYRAGVLL